MCNCEVCTRFRHFRSLGVPDEVLDYIEAIETDLDYHKAIMEGNWTSGKELLEEALKKYE
jgi:hypothetical protein